MKTHREKKPRSNDRHLSSFVISYSMNKTRDLSLLLQSLSANQTLSQLARPEGAHVVKYRMTKRSR